MAEYLRPDEEEEDERQEITQVAPSALAILNQSEHSAMVQTANLPSNRRKLAEFDSKLRSYATHSQPIALSMFYSLPRAGKQIIGPSVRFAEIVAPCWRNCAVGARVMGDSAATVTGQGIFIDYEANLRNSVEVPRRITDKEGRRYPDDMIVMTANAAMSVARRNCVLKGGVPQALWTPAYEDAQITAVGKAMSHSQRIAEALEYLHKLGVTEWQILNAVGVPSPRELETEHLLTLRVLCGEIKRGEKTIEQVFGSAFDKEIDSLFAQLKMNQAQQTMLRNSYMGRAQTLVEYLRERLQPVRQETPRPEPVREAIKVPIVAAEAPAPEPAAVEPTPETAFEFGANAAETPPREELSPFDAPAAQAAPTDPLGDFYRTRDQTPRPTGQTSMEPPPKRAGRPRKPQPVPDDRQQDQMGFEL
jgi:hypothetical protein